MKYKYVNALSCKLPCSCYEGKEMKVGIVLEENSKSPTGLLVCTKCDLCQASAGKYILDGKSKRYRVFEG